MNQKIVIPTIPNFIKVEIGKESVNLSVHEFSEAELRDIGEKWTASLIIKAKRYRENNY